MHHRFADITSVDLTIASSTKGLTNALDRCLNGFSTDRALFQRAQHASRSLASLKLSREPSDFTTRGMTNSAVS